MDMLRKIWKEVLLNQLICGKINLHYCNCIVAGKNETKRKEVM